MVDSEQKTEAVSRDETPGDIAARIVDQTGSPPFTFDLGPHFYAGLELDLLGGLRDQMEGISRTLLRPITEALEAAVLDLTRPVFRSLMHATDRAAPHNWPRGRPLDVYNLIRESGLPLVWVPGPEVIETLLDADASQLHDLLLSHSPEVVSGIGLALDAVDDPDLMGLALGAREAAQAYEHGLPMAAQALSAALFTALVHHVLGHERLKSAKESFVSDSSDSAPLRMMRYALLAHCGAQALSQYFPSEGDPIPHFFNRHASAHSLDPTQFTSTNALVGLMLVTGLLRELQEWQATETEG